MQRTANGVAAPAPVDEDEVLASVTVSDPGAANRCMTQRGVLRSSHLMSRTMSDSNRLSLQMVTKAVVPPSCSMWTGCVGESIEVIAPVISKYADNLKRLPAEEAAARRLSIASGSSPREGARVIGSCRRSESIDLVSAMANANSILTPTVCPGHRVPSDASNTCDEGEFASVVSPSPVSLTLSCRVTARSLTTPLMIRILSIPAEKAETAASDSSGKT